jgi:1,4-alpha-glucan branching enzyme
LSAKPIEFTLFAPYNEEAAVTGEWNNWQKTPMQKDDKGWWHVSVPLEDGEYEYKFALKSKSFFMVDQWVEVADPRAVKLTLDSLENSIITVKDGKQVVTTYEWKHDDLRTACG